MRCHTTQLFRPASGVISEKKKNPLPGDINATYGLARRSLSLVVSLFSIVTAQGKAKGRRDQLSQDENQERFRGDTEKYQDGGQ